MKMDIRYNDLNSYLRAEFGGRVQKIVVDAGFSCPNRDGKVSSGGCIFCNPKGSGSGAHVLGESVTHQLEQGKQALFRRYKAKMFLAYFQAFTNTYGPLERLKSIYDEALAVDGVVGLSIGTRPDCVDEDVVALLEGYAKSHLVWVEYGLQTVHDKTLKLINRGHDFACFEKAVSITQNRGIKICTHAILGLPGESREDMLETARVLGGMGIDGIKIHLLYVVKGTALETMYRAGDFRCLEQQEYADLVCEFLELLPESMVIQRVTGDPHPEELVDPQWSLRKTENLNLIRNTLKARDTWQGKCFSGKK